MNQFGLVLQGIGEPEVSVTFRLRQVVSDGRGLGAAVGGVGAVVDGAGVGVTQLPQLAHVEFTQVHQLLTHSAFGSVHTPVPHHTPADVEQLLRAAASVAGVSMHNAVEASTHIQEGKRSATILITGIHFARKRVHFAPLFIHASEENESGPQKHSNNSGVKL